MAPGGAYPSVTLGCTSCHDPHGNAELPVFVRYRGCGSRRIYRRVRRSPKVPASRATTTVAGRSNSNHTAYQERYERLVRQLPRQLPQQCYIPAECPPLRHGNIEATLYDTADVYNLYNGSDDQTGGSSRQPPTWPRSPVRRSETTRPARITGPTNGTPARSPASAATGPTPSSATDAGRWDFNVTFLHEDGDGHPCSYAIPNPYLATSGDNQRSLCNKCHNKDAG